MLCIFRFSEMECLNQCSTTWRSHDHHMIYHMTFPKIPHHLIFNISISGKFIHFLHWIAEPEGDGGTETGDQENYIKEWEDDFEPRSFLHNYIQTTELESGNFRVSRCPAHTSMYQIMTKSLKRKLINNYLYHRWFP